MQLTKDIYTTVINKHIHLFTGEPLYTRSPGRINIIGEHTDYNNGFVLPAAIDKAAYVAIEKRKDDIVRLFSSEYNEEYTCTLSDIHPVGGWPDYVLGVVHQFITRGYTLSGFTLLLKGDVPIGAGLSSSAAVECAVAYSVDHLFGFNLSRFELAKIAQAAEHTFAGVQCGIMDQFASLFGKKDHAIRLDCKTLEYEYIPLKMEGLKMVLLNTNVSHSLSSSEYNVRRAQCTQGVNWVKEQYPVVQSLRDVSMDMLQQCVKDKDALIYQRCKYVVEENLRLLSACNYLQQGNMMALGEKMFQSHTGLSKEYQVSCKELDMLVDWVKDEPAVLGARMMGGGFGGCTINLVKESAIEELVEKLSDQYYKETSLKLTAYIASVENGTTAIRPMADDTD